MGSLVIGTILLVAIVVVASSRAYSNGYYDGMADAYIDMAKKLREDTERSRNERHRAASSPTSTYRGPSHIKTWTPERIRVNESSKKNTGRG